MKSSKPISKKPKVSRQLPASTKPVATKTPEPDEEEVENSEIK
jgi:hypothetical protein